MNTLVGFPGVGLEFNLNPVAFTLFGKDIYWYGVLIALGMILAVIVCSRVAKPQGITSENCLDVLLIGAPCAIVGARLYYCIFKWHDYIKEPLKIFAVWEGGLAIYGGVIFGVLAVLWYCRRKKIPLLKMLDIGGVGMLVGQTVGRWGNFMNREAFGGPTNLPWRMELHSYSGITMSVHPTFLYESLWNFLGIFLLIYINKHKKQDGEACFTYFIWYGVGRFFIESLRTDSLMLGPIRFSQLFAAITAVAAATCLYFLKKKGKKCNL